MTDTEPPEEPFRVRDVFRRAKEVEDEPEDESPEPAFRRLLRELLEDEPEPKPETPPAPTEPPAAPNEGQPVTDPAPDGHRIPPWWEQPKPLRPGACQHPRPHAVRAQGTGQLVAYWCADCSSQLDVPWSYDELDEVTAGPVDGGGEGDAVGGGDEVPATIRARWNARWRPNISGTGEKKRKYSRPTYPSTPRQSLIGWWKARSAESQWLLYNGAALGVGYVCGLPQFVTEETAYLVHTYDSWTAPYVVIWYGVAAAVWFADAHTRTWLPPFAWLGRVPWVSLVVGVLLYGNPV